MKTCTETPSFDAARTLMLHWGIRAIGNTTAMLHGADNCDCIVIAHNLNYAMDLVKGDRRRAAGIDHLYERLAGVNKAVLVDHHVMQKILADMCSYIVELEQKIERNEKKP